jgi:hypothetical protein
MKAESFQQMAELTGATGKVKSGVARIVCGFEICRNCSILVSRAFEEIGEPAPTKFGCSFFSFIGGEFGRSNCGYAYDDNQPGYQVWCGMHSGTHKGQVAGNGGSKGLQSGKKGIPPAPQIPV